MGTRMGMRKSLRRLLGGSSDMKRKMDGMGSIINDQIQAQFSRVFGI